MIYDYELMRLSAGKGGDQSHLHTTEDPSTAPVVKEPQTRAFFDIDSGRHPGCAFNDMHTTEDPHPEMLDIEDERDDSRINEEYPLFSEETVEVDQTPTEKSPKKLHQRPLLLLAILVVIVYSLILGVPALFVYLRTH